MKAPSRAAMAALFAVMGMSLCSCAGSRHLQAQASASSTPKASVASRISAKLSPLAPSRWLPGGSRIAVAKVRPNDLRDLPTGRQRALVHESQRKGMFWFVGGPVQFKEPQLPEAASELDGSLLPPRQP